MKNIRLTHLLKNLNLSESFGQSNRLIMQCAVKLNGEYVIDLDREVTIGDQVNITVGKTKSFVGIVA